MLKFCHINFVDSESTTIHFKQKNLSTVLGSTFGIVFCLIIIIILAGSSVAIYVKAKDKGHIVQFL